ncbi:uncharacterized protein TNCV_4513281 [Trichonephila clavipes]|nr:uncharacterized protein TNCV_4513281 [Trichonephila clavipes]
MILAETKQATMMLKCHRCMQVEMMHRQDFWHPPRCTTALDNRWIMRMPVMNPAAASRTIAQQIQSFAHHSASTRTIQCRLQQSGITGRRPLIRLPLIGNDNRLRSHKCDGRRTTKGKKHCGY